MSRCVHDLQTSRWHEVYKSLSRFRCRFCSQNQRWQTDFGRKIVWDQTIAKHSEVIGQRSGAVDHGFSSWRLKYFLDSFGWQPKATEKIPDTALIIVLIDECLYVRSLLNKCHFRRFVIVTMRRIWQIGQSQF